MERVGEALEGDYKREVRSSCVGVVVGMERSRRMSRRGNGIGRWHRRRPRTMKPSQIRLGSDPLDVAVVVAV